MMPERVNSSDCSSETQNLICSDLIQDDRNIDSAASVQELTSSLYEFQQCGYLCDTLIVADDGHVRAHSVVLAAASPVFKRALKNRDQPVQHAVFLPGVQLVVVNVIIRFVYTGKIVLSKYECDDLSKIMSALDELEIKLHISSDAAECSDAAENGENIEHSAESAAAAAAAAGSGLELIETEDHISTCDGSYFLHDHQYAAPLSNSVWKGSYRCSPCGQQFFRQTDLSIHFVRFHTGKIPRAPVTDEQSAHSQIYAELSPSDGTTVQRANVTKPSVDVLAVCHLCGWISDKSMSLEAHMQSHGGGEQRKSKMHACNVCGKSFRVRWKFLRHAEEVHGRLPPGVSGDWRQLKSKTCAARATCDQCGYVSKTSNPMSEAFLEHVRKHTGERPFKCDTCSLTFSARQNLRRHKVLHSARRPFLCQYCAQSYQQKASLLTHMYREHADKLDADLGKRPRGCQICGERFFTDYHVRQHIDQKHTQNWSVVCEKCGRMCRGPSALTQHMLKHSTGGQYRCDECEKSFSMEGTLKLHKRLHSKNAFTCTICDRRFMYRSKLDRHMPKCTNRPRRAERGEPLTQAMTCTVCSKPFQSRSLLENHEHIHTGVKPFLCSTCGRAFRQRQHLRRHVRTHTKFKPYSCSLCSNAYSERVDLRRHSVRVHNVQLPVTTCTDGTRSRPGPKE